MSSSKTVTETGGGTTTGKRRSGQERNPRESGANEPVALDGRTSDDVPDRGFSNWRGDPGSEIYLIEYYRGQIDQQKRQLAELAKQLTGLAEQFKDNTSEVNQQKTTVDGLSKEIASVKADAVNTLAVFVAFFTFISVEFQILQSAAGPFFAISLSLFLLGGLALFVCLVKVVTSPIESKKRQNQISSLFVFSFAAIVLSIILICLSSRFDPAPVKDIQKQVDDFVSVQFGQSEILQVHSEKIRTLEEKKNPLVDVFLCLKIKGYFSQACFENFSNQ